MMGRNVNQALADLTRTTIPALLTTGAIIPNKAFWQYPAGASKHCSCWRAVAVYTKAPHEHENYHHHNFEKMREPEHWPRQFRLAWGERLNQSDQVLITIKKTSNEKQLAI